jgi:hypothetical protein
MLLNSLLVSASNLAFFKNKLKEVEPLMANNLYVLQNFVVGEI